MTISYIFGGFEQNRLRVFVYCLCLFLVHVVIVIVYVNFDPLFVVFSPAFPQLGAAEVFEAFLQLFDFAALGVVEGMRSRRALALIVTF